MLCVDATSEDSSSVTPWLSKAGRNGFVHVQTVHGLHHAIYFQSKSLETTSISTMNNQLSNCGGMEITALKIRDCHYLLMGRAPSSGGRRASKV